MSSLTCDSSAVEQYFQELSKREIERTRRLQIENNKREIPFKVLKFIGIGITLAIVLWALGKAFENANSFHKITEFLGTPQGQYQQNYTNPSHAPIKGDSLISSELDYVIDIDALLDSKPHESSDSSHSESGTQSNSEHLHSLNTLSDSVIEETISSPIGDQDQRVNAEIPNQLEPEIIADDPGFQNLEEDELKPEEGIRNYVIFDKIELDGEIIKKVVTGRSYPEINSQVSSSWCYVVNDNLTTRPSIYLINISDGKRVDAEIDSLLADEFGASIEEINLAKTKCTI